MKRAIMRACVDFGWTASLTRLMQKNVAASFCSTCFEKEVIIVVSVLEIGFVTIEGSLTY